MFESQTFSLIQIKLLPKEISPNPILSSTVELRFQDELASEFVEQFLARTLQDNFGMQKEDRPNESQETSNNIVFKNETFLVAIDKKSILFENVKHYQLWGDYFPFIKNVVRSINNDGIRFLERVGIRYISFFPKVDNVTMMLKKPFLMVEDEIGEVENSNFYGNYTFRRGKYRCAVQIGSMIQFPGEDKIREGCVIDLDISISDNIPKLGDEALFDIIDSLHSEEKSLFVALMNQDFMSTLNIKY